MNLTNVLPREHLVTVCKMGQRTACCRYLGMGSKGMICLKLDPGFKMLLDERVAANKLVAQGDNCPGYSKDGVASDEVPKDK